MPDELIQLDDVLRAQACIEGRVERTPTIPAAAIGRRLGLRLHLKAELFQRTGSFKVRGVLNRLAGLTPEQRSRGLVSMSAGNHAAALAYGATSIGAQATIVMPARAAQSKIDATREYGGEVVLTEGDLMQAVDELRRARGLTLIHPFDDPHIMAGHGTIGLEILDDVPDVDLVLVPIGGGGLIGGTAAAIKATRPTVRVVGVEPTGADAMTQALAAGKPVPIGLPHTVADGLGAPFAGVHPLKHVQAFVDDVALVDDDMIVEALRLVMTRGKLAPEPSGVATVAALMAGAVGLGRCRRVVCVISGGNMDQQILKTLL